MTVIKRCVYSADELMAPSEMDIMRTHTAPGGGFPTFDIGFYHKFIIQSYGRCPEQARDRIIAKMRRFYDLMNQVEGFQTLRLRNTEGEVPLNDNYVISYEIIYVVESTGSPTQNPESPYAGYQRDMRALSRRPRPVETSGALR